MVASGFAALGYQIVWTQQCAVWLGHEAAAVLAVVTAFFGGLAVGALVLGARIERSRRPWRWYAACEALIGLWSVALALLIAPMGESLLTLIGAEPTPVRQWGVAFCATFLLLLPATAAMGATLPAMERAMAQWHRGGPSLAVLYAGNTFGAVLGVLAAAFWLVPAFGFARTAGVCAVLNGACVIAAVALFRKAQAASRLDAPPMSTKPLPLPETVDVQTHEAAAGAAVAAGAAPFLWRLAATGLLGIGYEVLVVRVLSQVAENTVYTFAMLLAVYLVGSALGAAAYSAMCRRAEGPDPKDRRSGRSTDRVGDRLVWLLSLACLLGTASLWQTETVMAAVRHAAGTGMASALTAEAVLAVLAFALPTIAMGALFSHLSMRARTFGIGFGRALGANTLGACVAPLLFGVVLVPAIGPKFALLGIAAGYLALSSRPTLTRTPVAVIAAAALALAVWAPPLVFVDVPDGGRIVSYREGPMAAVSVVEDAEGVARLRIDNRQQEGSSSSGLADARQALLPLLLHPAPRRALFLGLGTGMTASAAADDPTLRVDAVELLPQVIEAAAEFAARARVDVRQDDRADHTAAPPGPYFHAVAADARRFVRTTERRYDVIVSDNFHPARSGSGALYTVEHFRAVRSRLAEGGLFCQWLPLHQLDRETLRSIVKAFMAVYPSSAAMLATNSLDTPVLGLVARADGGRFDVAQARERLAGAAFPQAPADVGLADAFALLGSFVAGPRSLIAFAGDAAINTDDDPVVSYLAPRITYAPDSLPRDRLIGLLREWQVGPDEIVASSAEPGFAARLAAYRNARDSFIEAGRDVVPSADLQRMLKRVREPLLSVLRTSPDFRPAYDPLLRMAVALARSDAPAARALLLELARVQPARPEAGQLLARMDDARP